MKVAPVTEKLRESRPRRFGHVKRGNRVLNLEMEGQRRVGEPRTRRMDVLQKDLICCGVSEELLQDRLE